MTAPRQWKILLIDDSEISLHFAEAALVRDGFEVRSTTSLDEFDTVVADWSPNLVLTDVNMPGMPGDELCKELKNRYETSAIPVVLFSSLDEAELAELARTCAADGYLCKRDGLDRLGAELRELCESLAW